MARLQLSNRPLLDTRNDAALFVGRENELTRLRRSLDLGLNVLLSAESGVGKTSLLRHYVWQERTARRMAPCYVSGATATTVTGLVELVATALVAGGLGVDVPAPPAESDALGHLRWLGGALQDRHDHRRGVVLLDEPDPDVAYRLFGQLRDEVWELPLVWVVALDTPDAVRLSRAPADAFFETRRELAPLDPAQIVQLLTRRIPDGAGEPPQPPLVTPEILAELAADGDPRGALDGARRLLTGEASWADIRHARQRRDEVVRGLGRPAQMMVTALRDVGGSASASDSELLERLGWTRSRAVQVLTDLEKTGLLYASTRPSGTGRPRKIYRLLEAGAA